MINNIVNLKMENGINVRVDKGETKVSQYEIKEHLEDLFMFKKKLPVNLALFLSLCFNFMLFFVSRPKSAMGSILYDIISLAILSTTMLVFYVQVKYLRKN